MLMIFRYNILFEIAKSGGVLVSLDIETSKSSFDRAFGHLARVLIKVDLSIKFWVNREGFSFITNLEYENFPHFCSHCQIIGLAFATCKHKCVECCKWGSR